MIRTLAVLCTLVTGSALAAPSANDAAPRILPAHDAEVTYRVSGPAADSIPFLGAGGAPTELRLQWSAGTGRLMVSAPGRPQHLLVDLPAHGATLLDDQMHAALFLPMRDTDVQGLVMADARFTRRGTSRVAGETCTDWAVRSSRTSGTVCVTDDGVPLRGEGDVNGRHGTFVATTVDRQAVDPATLTVPPGYNRIELPTFRTR